MSTLAFRKKMMKIAVDDAIARDDDYDYAVALMALSDVHKLHSEERKKRRAKRKELKALGKDGKRKEKPEFVLVGREKRKAAKKESKRKKWTRRKEQMLSRMNELSESSVLLSLDIEKFERQQSKITEIGLSIFGIGGEPKNIHYIVEENIQYKNKKFVPDNRENFMFGESIVMSIEDIKKELHTIIHNVDYIVGQAVSGDLTDLRSYWDMRISNVSVLDTQKLYMYMHDRRTGIKCGLISICEYFGIETEYLHNAGNDAKYTADVFKRLFQHF